MKTSVLLLVVVLGAYILSAAPTAGAPLIGRGIVPTAQKYSPPAGVSIAHFKKLVPIWADFYTRLSADISIPSFIYFPLGIPLPLGFLLKMLHIYIGTVAAIFYRRRHPQVRLFGFDVTMYLPPVFAVFREFFNRHGPYNILHYTVRTALSSIFMLIYSKLASELKHLFYFGLIGETVHFLSSFRANLEDKISSAGYISSEYSSISLVQILRMIPSLCLLVFINKYMFGGAVHRLFPSAPTRRNKPSACSIPRNANWSCPICLDEISISPETGEIISNSILPPDKKKVMLGCCEHSTCKTCFDELIRRAHPPGARVRCPLCRATVLANEVDELQPPPQQPRPQPQPPPPQQQQLQQQLRLQFPQRQPERYRQPDPEGQNRPTFHIISVDGSWECPMCSHEVEVRSFPTTEEAGAPSEDVIVKNDFTENTKKVIFSVCGHALCEGCHNNMVGNSNDGKFPCHICRRDVFVQRP